MRPNMENITAFVVGCALAWLLVDAITQTVAR